MTVHASQERCKCKCEVLVTRANDLVRCFNLVDVSLQDAHVDFLL